MPVLVPPTQKPVSTQSIKIPSTEKTKKIDDLILKFTKNPDYLQSLNTIKAILLEAERVGKNNGISAVYKQAMIIIKAILEGQNPDSVHSATTLEDSSPSDLFSDLLQHYINFNYEGTDFEKEANKEATQSFFMSVLTIPQSILDITQVNDADVCEHLSCRSKSCSADETLRASMVQILVDKPEYPRELSQLIKGWYQKGLPNVLNNEYPPPPPLPHSQPRPARPEQRPARPERPKSCCVVS